MKGLLFDILRSHWCSLFLANWWKKDTLSLIYPINLATPVFRTFRAPLKECPGYLLKCINSLLRWTHPALRDVILLSPFEAWYLVIAWAWLASVLRGLSHHTALLRPELESKQSYVTLNWKRGAIMPWCKPSYLPFYATQTHFNPIILKSQIRVIHPLCTIFTIGRIYRLARFLPSYVDVMHAL